MTLLAIVLIAFGLFFLVVGSIGMLRLPDVFVRAHALGLTDTVGAFLTLVGLAVYQGLNMNFVRILVVLALILLLNPVISHATLRAARRSGVTPQARRKS